MGAAGAHGPQGIVVSARQRGANPQSVHGESPRGRKPHQDTDRSEGATGVSAGGAGGGSLEEGRLEEGSPRSSRRLGPAPLRPGTPAGALGFIPPEGSGETPGAAWGGWGGGNPCPSKHREPG